MPTISIQFERGAVQKLQAAVRGSLRGLPRVLCDAINEALDKQKQQISQSIRARVNVKQADLDPLIRVGRASPSLAPSVSIDVSNRRLTLKFFSPQQQRGGVSYQVSRSGGARFVPQAFIGTRVSGEVIKRDGPRFVKLYGPSPFRMLLRSGLVDQTIERIENRLSAVVENKVQRMFSELKWA